MENRKKIILVGVLGAIVLFAFFVLYYNVRHSPLLSRRTSIKAEFRRINSLKVGSEVLFNGYLVGKVDDIYLKKDQTRMIVVDFSINPGIKLPFSSEAVSYVPTPLEDASLVIKFDTSRTYNRNNEEDWLHEGDVIQGIMGSYLIDIRDAADPYIKKMDTLVLQAFPGKDSIVQIIRDIEAAISRVESSTMGFRAGVQSNMTYVPQLMQKIENIAQQTNRSRDSINISMKGLVKTTDKFRSQDIAKKIPLIHPDSFSFPNFDSLQLQLVTLQQRLDNINSGKDSTVAKLLYDKNFKDSTVAQINQLGILLSKIRQNPEKYLSTQKTK